LTPLPIRSPLHVWTYFQPFGCKLLPVSTSGFQNRNSYFWGKTE